MEYLEQLFSRYHDFFIGVATFVVAVILGLVVKLILFKLLRLYNRHDNPVLVKSLTAHLSKPIALFLPLLFVSITLATAENEEEVLRPLRRLIEIMNILTFAWILIELTNVARDMVRHKYAIDKPDNYRERKLFTQLQFLRKLTIILIVFVAVSLVLLSFEPVRKLGTGLLTSAGVAGIVIGFAAQRSIANLLAGLQLAFTQPIRLDDVLVVEGEFGRVEEITMTYVVLRIWDNRRLILPLNYFIDKPFQNWTRTSSDILATVYLYTDYSLPIDAVRQEFDRILANTPLWDKNVKVLQVTDSKEKTLELRALMSANSSAVAWDLRCLVREKLIHFIQQNYPESLPKTRSEFVGNKLPAIAELS
ncbi:small-conductance mechanosensitive channel [Pontibacter ummariensis]|uniref:Small-conductance mechanosensitive channel n=1 Tax=Pontibacter ummariensis TaxID=1610492 RepID=A0A239IP37_9BACT|nr:mechanosensitive ion channel domain-containing protein [Pontibacter ummariensis]PRY09733.1 small-conductance mechanosensitive channel [Pontibacter ummariensis]SNS94833.1 Small-conductance mechanosensitive channel [Pontibacter ummariensis]